MTNPEKHIALVCNPSRENVKALPLAQSIDLLLKGMNISHSLFTEVWPESFDGYTEVWIAGGDGTINWFINQYPDIQLPLALFGGGSGNDFHWMLYGDVTAEQQVEKVLEARPQPVDAGICNGKLFVNGVGIGFDGAIVHDLLGKKKLAGKASYLLSILKQIVGYRETACELSISNETIKENCFMISVANGRRYGGGFHVAPNAILTDGLLDINIVGRISPIKRMRYLPVIEKGEHLNLDFITYKQANKITIKCAAKLHAHLDGEYMQSDVFEIEVLPKRFSFLY